MDKRLVTVGAIAGVAVVAAAWIGYAEFGGGREVRSASLAGRGGGGDSGPSGEQGTPRGQGMSMQSDQVPRWVAEDPAEAPGAVFQFSRHSSPGEAASALGGAQGAMRDIAEASSELSGLGAAPKFGIVDSWLEFTQPLVADDEGAFIRAYERLGGVMRREGAEEGASTPPQQLFARLRGHFAGASIDTGRIVLRAADAENPMEVPLLMRGKEFPKASAGDIPMMIARTATAGADGAAEASSVAMAIPLELAFPKAARSVQGKAPVVELWAPMRLAGQKSDRPDVGVSTYLVWSGTDQAWQPVALRLKLRSEEAQSRMPGRGG